MIQVLGGDLSLTATGLCLPDGATVTLNTGLAKRGDRRLVEIRKDLSHYLRTYALDLVVLERSRRFKSSDANLAVGMVHGVVREVLAEWTIPFAYIDPNTLKAFATGDIRADKQEMVISANQARKAKTSAAGETGGEGEIADHNQADAWWLRQMGLWWALGSACGLPEIGQLDSDGHGLRNRSVFGPWSRTPGAKWPDRIRATTTRY